MLAYLVRRGHRCRVVADCRRTVLDGVSVGPRERGCYDEVDVVITHLDRTRAVVTECRARGLPLLHVIHNDSQLAFHRVDGDDATCVIFNSEWLRRASSWPGPWTLCRPPVDVAAYAVDHPTGPAGFVTLVNLLAAKGAGTFWRLAGALPSQRFLAVRGAYGVQTSPPPGLANVTVIDQTASIAADVYARSSVVCMPSHYESWGRVAIEASAASIPVVAHPTPGLRESLGHAGIFARHDRPSEWVTAVGRLLEDPDHYRDRADAGRRRALELADLSAVDLQVFEETVARCAP